MAKHSSVHLHLGPLSISLPALLGVIGGVAILTTVGVGAWSHMNKQTTDQSSNQATEESVGLRAYTISEITGGNYYVKDGDAFYLPAKGLLYSSVKNDNIIAKKADPKNRIAMFHKDDTQIPTMYSDSLLIYKAPEGGSVPEECVLERYRDEGYSIGIRGLSIENGKCRAQISGVSFYPGASISTIGVAEGTDLIIDKIDGVTITEQSLSEAGTIKNLEQGHTYTVDLYSGTTYIGGEYVADTHMFSSMERFVINEYSMDPSNYAILSFPKDLWSGYYYVNGIGMIRYINHPRASGDEIDNWNEEYYVTDVNGNITTNPANVVTDVMEEKESVWNYRFPVDEGKPHLSVRVTCTGDLSNVSATLFSPEGRRTELQIDEESQVLSGTVEAPSAGAWILSLTGVKDRVFDVNVDYTEFSGNAPVSTVIKDSDKPVQATIVLGKPLHDAYVTFRWENSEYAGTFKLEGPDGKVYGNMEDPSSVTKEIYGEVRIHTGAMLEGQYTFTAEGKSLGHIYITYEDAAPEEGEETGEISAELYDVSVGEDAEEDTETETEAETETEGANAREETEASQAGEP